jgi:hypothetical protein
MPERFLKALAQAPAYLSLFCRTGKIVWANVYGHGLDNGLVGQPSDSIIRPADRPAWWSAFYRARDRREVVAYAVTCDTPDPPFVLKLAGWLSPVLRDDVAVMVCCVCRDVTHDPEPPAPALPPPVRPPEIPEGALWLSPMEQRVVTYLAGRWPGWTCAESIAAAVSECYGNRFKAILTALSDRRILEACSGSGYRLRA